MNRTHEDNAMKQEQEAATGTDVRQPAWARQFYPGHPSELRREVNRYLAGTAHDGTGAKAILAPHAGYPYSGSVAGSAFRSLGTHRTHIRKVVLIGPCHRMSFRGLALPSHRAFATPLRDTPVDVDAMARLAAMPGVRVLDAAHAEEHSLEVELPFLQVLLHHFEVIPILVGDEEPQAVARALEAVWGGEETVIVISSDLSHYLDYATARARDSRTAAAIVAGDLDAIHGEDACGWAAIRGFLVANREHRLKAALLDLRNSGDTAGSRNRVVGYGAFAFFPEAAQAG